MNSEIIKKIVLSDKKKTAEKIVKRYKEQLFGIINFIYFANLKANNLLKEEKENKYEKALLESDYILPDWIAMKIYMQKKRWLDIHNLNWTDFIPFFLDYIKKEKTNLYMYWSDNQTVEKAKENIEKQFNLKVNFCQNWYSDFDFEKIYKKKEEQEINLLLVGRWTPLQEIWSMENIKKIKDKQILIMNVWGLFDFIWGKEKRAPFLIRKTKLEWLWRLCFNPKKNYKKVINSFSLFKEIFKK